MGRGASIDLKTGLTTAGHRLHHRDPQRLATNGPRNDPIVAGTTKRPTGSRRLAVRVGVLCESVWWELGDWMKWTFTPCSEAIPYGNHVGLL